MRSIRDFFYLARRELRDAIVERYARPLRERVSELERDNSQLHLMVATDTTRVNNVINAARAVSECKEDAERTGPCGACLETLDGAVEAVDGKNKRIYGRAAKRHG